jgi:hypothetical protein
MAQARLHVMPVQNTRSTTPAGLAQAEDSLACKESVETWLMDLTESL